MNVPLALLPVTRSQPPVSAGWLASSDPVEWLRELAHCRRQGCEVALYPVAASPADPRAVGVLLLPRGAAPEFRPRVQRLAELLPGVHAPRDAGLSAGLLPNERRFFFPYAIHLFHPTLGWVGFEAKDELPAARLLEAPREPGALWNAVLPVDRFAPVLKSIAVTLPPDPGEMLAAQGGEIGDRAGRPVDEKIGLGNRAALLGKGLAGGAVLGAGWVLNTLGKLGGAGPGGASSGAGKKGPGASPQDPGSLDRLREWAQKNWQHLMDRRSREIDRLMELLEKDPDRGLHYALPLSGIEQSRGAAPPSWSLGRHGTNFSHGHGGGAIDGWDLGRDARLKLERQYREAALREIALGRYERAAYIYANLLGDWTSAAKALIDGHRYRDAVAIYLHKLNNRPAAAKCLEDAGLLDQAAALYAECRQFEKAGDLHARLGNREQARELWQAEVEAQRDPIVKARLLAEKLDDPAAALELLDAAWRSGNRSQVAIGAIFALYRQRDAIAEAVALLRQVFEHPLPAIPLRTRLKFCHEEVLRWPDPRLAAEFEKQAFRRIGRELSQGSRDGAGLLAFLPQLAPDDRLLVRDARRFSVHRHPPKVASDAAFQGLLRPQQIVRIPSEARWDSISPLPKGISVAGYGADMLAVAQLRDTGCHASALRTPDDPGGTVVRHLAVTSSRGSSRLFHFTGFRRLHYRSLDRMRTPEDDALGTLRDVLAVGPYGDEGDFAVLQYTRTSSLSVHLYSETAAVRRTLTLDLAPPDIASMDWWIAGRGGHLCLAAGGFVAWRFPTGEFSTMNLGQAPCGLHLSPVPGTQEALLLLSNEILLVEVTREGKPLEAVNLYSDPTARAAPVACYLPDGSIVIAHAGEGLVYPPGDRLKANAKVLIPSDAGRPVDVCARGRDGFAILTAAGNLLVYSR